MITLTLTHDRHIVELEQVLQGDTHDKQRGEEVAVERY